VINHIPSTYFDISKVKTTSKSKFIDQLIASATEGRESLDDYLPLIMETRFEKG